MTMEIDYITVCFADIDSFYDPNAETYCGKKCKDIVDKEYEDYDTIIDPVLFDNDLSADKPCEECLNTPEGQMKILADTEL